ncbi:hypothetical protein WR25_13437 [Diploscapter pachys]|uniref:Nuclear pore complex protein n=1 Tax=Diploscapter pachys TaxID=2018661 RepID=A0A2A2KGH3_9BILA|nr:hypothetical protein WR25_13437 [Diploscapter pachys]
MDETYVMEGNRNQQFVENIADALNEDFHDALLDFVKTENESIWENLYSPLEAGLLALNRLEPTATSASAGLKTAIQNVNGELRTYSFFVMLTQIENEFAGYNNPSYLRDLIVEDQNFRQIYTLWRWTQAGAEQEKRGFADLKRQYKEMEHVKDIRSGTARSLASATHRGKLGIDLDCEAAEEDQENTEKLIAILFSLVRSGQVDEASELARKKGASSLCLLLNIYSLAFDPALSPRNDESTFSLCVHNLVLLHSTFKRLIPSDDVHSRMLRSAVCGFTDPLLSLATRTDDRLWAIANGAVLAKFFNYIGVDLPNECPNSVESIFSLAAGEGRHCIHFATYLPMPRPSISLRFSGEAKRKRARRKEIAKEKKDGDADLSPYYKITNLLLNEQWRQVLEWASGRKGEEETVRLRAALAIICYVKLDKNDDPCCSQILMEYIEYLRKRSLFRLIPFFASFLSTELAAKCLKDTMNEMRSADDRAQFLRASEDASFNKNVLSRGVAQSAIDGINNSEIQATEAVDKWKWLLYDEETFDEALVLANTLIRRFLLSNSVDLVKHIVTECSARAIPDFLQSSEVPETQRALSEFQNHSIYLEALDAYENYMQKVLEAKAQMQSIENDRNEGKEERKQRVRARLDVQKEKTADVLIKFIRHRGWKNVAAGRQEEERREQLASLRDRIYRSMLDKLMTVFDAAEDSQGVVEVANLLAESALNLPLHISKANLRALLDRVHRLAGHIFTES